MTDFSCLESGDSMLLGGVICLAAMVLGVALCVIGEKLWRKARKKRAIASWMRLLRYERQES